MRERDTEAEKKKDSEKHKNTRMGRPFSAL